MPSGLSAQDVRRIAALARLELSETEIALYTRQLAEILAYAADIQAVDTAGVSPTSHVLSRGPAWRADAPEPSLNRDDVLGEAPDGQRAAGVFRVPKVL